MGIGGPENTAFEFEGRWQDFLKIGLVNAFLSVVTLGIYRFWATTRERRYLWSQTRFIDDRLEWTGTGLELFIGAIVALVLLGIPLILLQLIAQGLIFRDMELVAGLLGFAIYLFLLALAGFAIFRGLRYRLSRTYWHGIHGGSDNPGFAYGWSYLWKSIAGTLALGLLIPWSYTQLWKERWDAMTFGPHNFESSPSTGPLMKRFLLFYAIPTLAFIGSIAVAIVGGASGAGESFGYIVGFAFLGAYLLLPLIALAYYAAYLREVIGTLSLSTLDFAFTARTIDWFKLALGNFGLFLLAIAVGSLVAGAAGVFSSLGELGALGIDSLAPVTIVIVAIGFLVPIIMVGPLVRYRSWAFFIRYLEAGGEVNLDQLTQSTTRPLSQGEGLLDALDMGAI
jgi:uncharacterized membrane protein YjgN (DUF898 family)